MPSTFTYFNFCFVAIVATNPFGIFAYIYLTIVTFMFTVPLTAILKCYFSSSTSTITFPSRICDISAKSGTSAITFPSRVCNISSKVIPFAITFPSRIIFNFYLYIFTTGIAFPSFSTLIYYCVIFVQSGNIRFNRSRFAGASQSALTSRTTISNIANILVNRTCSQAFCNSNGASQIIFSICITNIIELIRQRI